MLAYEWAPALFGSENPLGKHAKLAAYWRAIADDPIAARLLAETRATPSSRRTAARARCGQPRGELTRQSAGRPKSASFRPTLSAPPLADLRQVLSSMGMPSASRFVVISRSGSPGSRTRSKPSAGGVVRM